MYIPDTHPLDGFQEDATLSGALRQNLPAGFCRYSFVFSTASDFVWFNNQTCIFSLFVDTINNTILKVKKHIMFHCFTCNSSALAEREGWVIRAEDTEDPQTAICIIWFFLNYEPTDSFQWARHLQKFKNTFEHLWRFADNFSSLWHTRGIFWHTLWYTGDLFPHFSVGVPVF